MLQNERTYQRWLPIDGAFNVRDIGGYSSLNGKRTLWRQLLRSDKLDQLTPASQDALLGYGIRMIVDLRYSPEVVESPDAVANSDRVTYIHLPLYELSGSEALPVIPNDAGELYRLILDYRQTQIKGIFDVILSPGALPMLIHCTAGKDRTGLIIALVLGALDVPYDTIINDYMLSERRVAPLLSQLREQAIQNGLDVEWYERLLACKPEYMRDMLNHLDTTYGGVVPYLNLVGVTGKQIGQLRQLLLE